MQSLHIQSEISCPNLTGLYYSKVRGISHLSTTYKFYRNILLSRLTPYAEEITEDDQCRFRRSMLPADHILCIRQIIEKEWEYNESVHQLFIDF
jgi:hypothetical protein